ncbi:hypothetical protein CB1_000844015 [Camelus ferus]|nr:hypothetical protein CB1_000844015 [Camelus ferus]
MSPNIVLDFTEENALRQVRVVTRQTTAEELLRSYSEPVDVKASQPPPLVNSKPPAVFPGPSQAHSALYLSSHYHQQPGMSPHLTAMHPSLPRSIAPKASNQMPVTVSIANMAVSPPPPLQISPPLHQHLNLQPHQPLSMQQPLGNQLPMQVQPALHSPTLQQGFNLQPDYQTIINPTSTAAQVVTQAMEYVRSGCRNPPAQPVDWNSDYCSSGKTSDTRIYGFAGLVTCHQGGFPRDTHRGFERIYQVFRLYILEKKLNEKCSRCQLLLVRLVQEERRLCAESRMLLTWKGLYRPRTLDEL